jgi:hypothetical protein
MTKNGPPDDSLLGSRVTKVDENSISVSMIGLEAVPMTTTVVALDQQTNDNSWKKVVVWAP